MGGEAVEGDGSARCARPVARTSRAALPCTCAALALQSANAAARPDGGMNGAVVRRLLPCAARAHILAFGVVQSQIYLLHTVLVAPRRQPWGLSHVG